LPPRGIAAEDFHSAKFARRLGQEFPCRMHRAQPFQPYRGIQETPLQPMLVDGQFGLRNQKAGVGLKGLPFARAPSVLERVLVTLWRAAPPRNGIVRNFCMHN
jgi:hypothetical protein